MTTARTPKGRKVTTEITAEYGSYRLQAGRIFFGGIAVAGWNEGGSGTKSLQDALTNADEAIDKAGLETEDEKETK